MKQVISFFFFFLSLSVFSCEIKNTTSILSLSGPITHLLKELKLLRAPIVGISEFHGIDPKEFIGTIFKGGLFLSPKILKDLQNPIVFFDESLEQRKTFKKLNLQSVEVFTKNKDPFEVYEISKIKLIPFLRGCDFELNQLQKKVDQIQTHLSNSSKHDKYYFFYLGEIKKNQRKPNLIMVDNFVLALKKSGIIKTYPSLLNYIPWSEKVVHDYENKNLFSIGLVTSAIQDKDFVIKKVGEREFNFYHPALLIPGLAQINFLENLVNKLPY